MINHTKPTHIARLNLMRAIHRERKNRLLNRPRTVTRIAPRISTNIWNTPIVHSFSRPLSGINKEYNEKEERKEKKEMNWAQAKKAFPKLSPFKDADKDGIYNMFDCKPFDRKRQGPEHKQASENISRVLVDQLRNPRPQRQSYFKKSIKSAQSFIDSEEDKDYNDKFSDSQDEIAEKERWSSMGYDEDNASDVYDKEYTHDLEDDEKEPESKKLFKYATSKKADTDISQLMSKHKNKPFNFTRRSR